MLNLRNDRELLQLVAIGDEKAFKLLFDTYRKRLFNYITRFIKSEQVAEELVMDVFMKIWTGRELVTQINNLDGFLFRIAHNKSIDFLRAAATDLQLKELLWDQIQIASGEKADNLVLVREYEEKLREAIALLSPQRRKSYNLSRDQDLTHDQIAQQLNISRATVNNHIVEAQKFIRSYLFKEMGPAVIFLVLERF